MENRNQTLPYLILIVLGIFGAWLSGLFGKDKTTEEVTGLTTVAGLLGVFILFGVVGGTAFLISRNRQPMTQEQKLLWEQIRYKGKLLYIRNFVTKVTLWLLIGLSFPLLYNYLSGESMANALKTYGAIAFIFIVCLPFIAYKIWNYYEREYGSLTPEKHHMDSSE